MGRTRSLYGASLVAISLVVAAACGVARADEVQFLNGDRLTGTILSAEGGKLKIKTAVAGEVTVELKDVRTFTTDAPVELRTKSGDRITAPAAASDQAGQVTVQPAAAAQPQAVPLTDLKYLNFSEAWTGALLVGAQFARGNTFSDQANVAFDVARRTEQDRWTFTGAYNFGRQRDPATGNRSTSTDNWNLTGKYDYFFTEKFYGFGSFRYEHDRIADLDYRLIPGVGVGYLWADRPDLKFDTEAGLAYVYDRFGSGETDENLSARLAYHLKKNLSGDKVTLFHNLEFYPSLEDIRDVLVVTDAGVRASLTPRMFAEYKIEYRYDATPAEGFDHNDLRHIVGVGWKF
jgi:putative salt-induced outer membrane protein YdiY